MTAHGTFLKPAVSENRPVKNYDALSQNFTLLAFSLNSKFTWAVLVY
ncbi:hypothetical protein PARC_p0070 (plasmid) [Pseudoalteromonas arctica A 37-1-2]|jgi:hypothetical protein|uniref:Uncharacterized protein n=1 Tax=Pseudoalteromonas arctica A 37-1-2 TaxID=1117313 RepID=A0A290SA85_9GAMM|nr:hypothetical protein PARC_p0070 [Pseudoalteromonas arctica A 37-1-2]